MRNLFNREAMIRSRASSSEDRYGDKVYSYTTRGPFPCRLEDASSTELNTDRETVVSVRRVFLPAEAALSAYDEMVVEDVTYRVDGDPIVRDGLRNAHHIEARIIEVRA